LEVEGGLLRGLVLVLILVVVVWLVVSGRRVRRLVHAEQVQEGRRGGDGGGGTLDDCGGGLSKRVMLASWMVVRGWRVRVVGVVMRVVVWLVVVVLLCGSGV